MSLEQAALDALEALIRRHGRRLFHDADKFVTCPVMHPHEDAMRVLVTAGRMVELFDGADPYRAEFKPTRDANA